MIKRTPTPSPTRLSWLTPDDWQAYRNIAILMLVIGSVILSGCSATPTINPTTSIMIGTQTTL